MTGTGICVDLGLRDFAATWELQKRLLARRQAQQVEDALLLVEHPEVITLGRRAESRSHVLDATLPIHQVERGGDVTYHGPGQLVGYPIVQLGEGERDLHAYLRALEEGLIAVCAEVGLTGCRRDGWTGVWLGDHKVASIGIAVRRWVTLHGFALNVSTALERFYAIHPCGLDAAVMTSLSHAANRPITVEQIKPLVAEHIGRALRRTFRRGTLIMLGEPGDL